MKKFIVSGVLLAVFAQCTFAAFVQPTAAQIAAAAADPTAIAALLKDATPEQAANVVNDVLKQILALHLQAGVQKARVAALITEAFKAIPAAQAGAFAAALGAVMGGDAATRGLVDDVKASIPRPLVGKFTSAAARMKGAPPVVIGYDAQNLK